MKEEKMENRKEKDERFRSKMHAWMMIQVIGQTSVNFLNIKKLKKEMTEHLCCFLEGDELKEFALYFIEASLGSKSYRTAVFGTMSMSDAGAATRLAQDIDEVTYLTPKKFGMEYEYAGVRAFFLDAFREKIDDADRILKEAGVV